MSRWLHDNLSYIEQKRSTDLDELVSLYNDDEANYLVTFVYGTLRPGEGNYWIEPEVVKYWEPATTPGRMFASGIPFVDFRNCQKGDKVVGTVLVMEPGPLSAQMIGMERGAGYEPISVPVTVQVGDEEVIVECLVWQYDSSRSVGRYAGQHVPSGDFRQTTGSRYARRILDQHPVR